MFVDFSRTEIALDTHSAIPNSAFQDMLYECAAVAVSDPTTNVYIVCAHQPVAGEHDKGLECWCCPDEIVFGVQPFFSIA